MYFLQGPGMVPLLIALLVLYLMFRFLESVTP